MHLFALFLRLGQGVEAIFPWEAEAEGQPGGAMDGETVRICHGKSHHRSEACTGRIVCYLEVLGTRLILLSEKSSHCVRVDFASAS